MVARFFEDEVVVCRSGCGHWSRIVQIHSQSELLELCCQPWQSFVVFRSKSVSSCILSLLLLLLLLLLFLSLLLFGSWVVRAGGKLQVPSKPRMLEWPLFRENMDKSDDPGKVGKKAGTHGRVKEKSWDCLASGNCYFPSNYWRDYFTYLGEITVYENGLWEEFQCRKPARKVCEFVMSWKWQSCVLSSVAVHKPVTHMFLWHPA